MTVSPKKDDGPGGLMPRFITWMFRTRLKAAISIALMVTFCIVIAYRIEVLAKIEWTFYDVRLENRSLGQKLDKIVIVDVDQESYESLNEKFPYPLSYHARVVENLTKAGAKVIAFDIIFDVASRDSSQDSLFARAMAKAGNVILAESFQHDVKKRMGDIIVTYKQQSIRPNNILLSGNPYLGFVSVLREKDDSVRRSFIVYQNEEEIMSSNKRYHYAEKQLVPSLALQAVKLLNSIPDEAIYLEPGTTAIHTGNITIPMGNDGSILVNFYGSPRTFPTITYSSVYNDDVLAIKLAAEPNFFRDKIVLVGVSLEEFHDRFTTPFVKLEKSGTVQRLPQLMPGVEIHANAIQTILDNAFISKMSKKTIILYFFAIFLFSSFMTIILGPKKGLLFILAELAVLIVLCFFLFLKFNYWLDITHAAIGILITYGGNIFYQYITEEKEKRYIRSAFSHYLNPSVVEQLASHPETLKLGGQKKVLTVMFSDIRGFTSLSETLDPEQLTNFLNEYLTAMTDIILAKNGTVDKYMGDAIMAFWGAPLDDPDHAYHCCLTCLEQMQKLREMQAQWREQKRHVIDIGLGVNTGEMTVGNMGSSQRFDYTVLGDSVNLASRLEGTNKDYHTNIIINESTNAAVKERFITRKLDKIRVKGKHEPVEIYELIAKKDDLLPAERLAAYAAYERGLTAYFGRDWPTAIQNFEAVIAVLPNDGPATRHLEQCRLYQQNPPPADWDGVYVKTSK